ncbi:hypothetical protein IMSAG049_01717 [Clostridiales bacterium]|nr:hypothetical protein IMSAG049_01717 [Clostridiales bacterium]
MARAKNKTTKEKLEEAKLKKENLSKELVEIKATISELEEQLQKEELIQLNEALKSLGLTVSEALKLIASKSSTQETA